MKLIFLTLGSLLLSAFLVYCLGEYVSCVNHFEHTGFSFFVDHQAIRAKCWELHFGYLHLFTR